MPNEEQEVKQIDATIVIPPSADTGDDEIIEPIVQETDTPAPSSEEEKPIETEEAEDPVVEPSAEPEVEAVDVPIVEPKPVPGETPVERALRKEVERVKGLLRKEKSNELFVPSEVPPTRKALSEDKKKILEKYDPEQLSELGVIIEAKAEEMGFVRKEELSAQNYSETADGQLQSFLDDHKEYLPENDKDSLLWNRFRDEFGLYKQPTNPKDFKKIFNKVHESIFGVQATSNLNKINAQQQKIKTASHTGSMATRSSAPAPKAPNTNIRYDMLKGFDEDELKELGAN